jgi:hypothetical protein
MKTLIISTLLICSTFTCFAESNDSATIQNLKSGFFVRQGLRQYNPGINPEKSLLGTVSKNPTLESDTYYFIRFDSIFTLKERNDVYITKLFVSNRYFGDTYSKKFDNEAAIKNESHGLYLIGKIYKDRDTDKYRLNIYTDYTTNLVTKKMYPNASLSKDYTTHLQKLIGMAMEDNPDSTFYIEYKCFSIEPEKLTLLYTKYARSDDKITTSSYHFDFSKYSDTKSKAIEVVQKPLVENIGSIDDSKSDLIHQLGSAKIMTRPGTISDTLVALQSSFPKESWVYAGMINKHKKWETQYLKIEKDSINAVSLFDLNLRDLPPEKSKNGWQKGKIIYVCPKDKKLIILKKELIPYYKDGNMLIWLKVAPKL